MKKLLGRTITFKDAIVVNDVGGTSFLPRNKKYHGTVTKVWHDYETGWHFRATIDPKFAQVTKAAIVTPSEPKLPVIDFTTVYVSEWDLS